MKDALSAAALWAAALSDVALAALDGDGDGVCEVGTADPGARFGNLRMVLCAADLDAPEPMISLNLS